MKNILIKATTIFLSILFAFNSFSQNVEINYQSWNPSNLPCNLFGTATNVPSTIGSTTGTIVHQTQIGQPTYSTTATAVELQAVYNSASDIRGTKYRIEYDFKANYTYYITVNAAASVSTVGVCHWALSAFR